MPLVKRCLSGLLISVTALARPWDLQTNVTCHFPYSYSFIAFSLDLLATERDEDSGVQRVPQNASFQVSKLHLRSKMDGHFVGFHGDMLFICSHDC